MFTFTRITLVLASIGLLGSALTACGSSSDGPTCSSVCAYINTCDAEQTVGDCILECNDMQDIFRPAVFSSMGDCILGLSCEQFNSGGDSTCMTAAIIQGKASAGDDMIAAVCEKIVSCDTTGATTQAACVAQMLANAEGEFEIMGMLKDSVLNCIENCFSNTPCELLEDATEACFADCGLNFGQSDVTP